MGIVEGEERGARRRETGGRGGCDGRIGGARQCHRSSRINQPPTRKHRRRRADIHHHLSDLLHRLLPPKTNHHHYHRRLSNPPRLSLLRPRDPDGLPKLFRTLVSQYHHPYHANIEDKDEEEVEEDPNSPFWRWIAVAAERTKDITARAMGLEVAWRTIGRRSAATEWWTGVMVALVFFVVGVLMMVMRRSGSRHPGDRPPDECNKKKTADHRGSSSRRRAI